MNRRRFRSLVEDFKFPKRVDVHPKHVVYFSNRIEGFKQLIPRKIECKAKGADLRIISIEGTETAIRAAVTVAPVYYTECTSKRRGRAKY